MEVLTLTQENGYLPDPKELARLAEGGVKLICLNNPNNPHRGPHAGGAAGGDHRHRPAARGLHPVRRGCTAT